jgi:predicted O-linked N-acetylglucosamine transferase (SPINDLY family)
LLLALSFHLWGENAGKNKETPAEFAQLLPVSNHQLLRDRAKQCFSRGNFTEARDWLQKLIAADAASGEIWCNLGHCHAQLGKTLLALEAYEQACVLNPSHLDSLLQSGRLHETLGQVQAAAGRYHQAAQAFPDNSLPWRLLAKSLVDLGELDAAREILAIAIELAPEHPDGHRCLAEWQELIGEVADAKATLKEAVKFGSLPEVRLLLCDDQATLEGLYHSSKVHAAARGKASADSAGAPGFESKEKKKRPTRVAFLSPDFRRHALAHFIEPLFQISDASSKKLIPYFYDDASRPDSHTASLQHRAESEGGCWRKVRAHTNEALAFQFKKDRIDILVDLNGLWDDHRLGLFALRPVSRQFTWLGYPATTGLDVFDGRISDRVIDPPDSQQYSSEPLLYLEPGAHCYRPLEEAPGIIIDEKSSSGRVVRFGSFNHVRKLNEKTLNLWGQILSAVPESILLLKDRRFSQECARRHVFERLAAHGVAAGRIELRSYCESYQDHLRAYNEVDIGLDPYPYNGTTTLCDAYTMGVGSVTLGGEVPQSRVGTSFANQLGIESEFVAQTEGQYIAKAVALAARPDYLRELKKTLPEKLNSIALGNPSLFAKELARFFLKNIGHQR